MMIAGCLAIVAGLFLCWRLRDKPQTVGLPAVGDWRHDELEIAQQQEGAISQEVSGIGITTSMSRSSHSRAIFSPSLVPIFTRAL
jgi:sugar phosphate permease